MIEALDSSKPDIDSSKPDKIDIKNFSLDKLEKLMSRFGERPYRARQVMQGIYMHNRSSFAQITVLPKALRDKLEEAYYISTLVPEDVKTSEDGTQKYLFRLEDGNTIESVLIPGKGYFTLCLSTQVGCAQGCRFCLTGKRGFTRNLTTSEIVNQILGVRKSVPENTKLTNLVLMGMGEPLANYENSLEALRIITNHDGLGFSKRRVTLSTAGLLPRIQMLGRDIDISLAVSLNAADNQTRSLLMPINKKYPIERLIKACKSYPLPARRRITFEYILISGINDSEEHAYKLTGLLKGIRCKINLIPFNEHPWLKFKRPDAETTLKFQKVLTDNHYTALIRESRGSDIHAACGQLYGAERGLKWS